MTKCFCYLRVSGKGQVRRDGFRRQFIAIRQYCSQNNLQIVRVFKERGVSGTKELDDRPALSQLLIALEENGIKTTVIEKMDRLARDLMIQETIVADMQRHGYTILSTAEPDLCSSDPSRVLIRQVFGAIAQYDRAMTVLRLRGARERQRIKDGIAKGYSREDAKRYGKNEGRKAFGEKYGEQPILTEMLSLKSAGQSCNDIADILNDRGIPTRSKKCLWTGGVIKTILRREVRKCRTTEHTSKLSA